MKGFTDKAILVLPRYASYNNRPAEWKRLFRESLGKLMEYLELEDIFVYTFNSDEINDLLNLKSLKLYDIVTPEDKMLLENFLLGGEKVPKGEEFDDKDRIFKEVRKKYPVKRGSTLEEKKDIFIKRDKWIANEIIKNAKLVINCEPVTKAYYKVKSKEGDGRIVLQVNQLNFAIEAKLAGEPVDVVSIFNYNRAYSPLYSWEV